MAVAMLAEVPGLTREQYELVVTKVNESGSPAGVLFHAGGPIEGGFRILEVWETPEAAEKFYTSDVLKQATAPLPEEQQQPKVIMTWPVSGVDDSSGWRRIV
jgi:quinol monooxygenase YgiN